MTCWGLPFSEAVPEALEKKKLLLSSAFDRLQNLPSHVGLTHLRLCFSTPKLTYLVRTCPTWLWPQQVASVDDTIKGALENIHNVSLEDDAWVKAAIPIRFGSLVVRRLGDIGLAAFLASARGVSGLVATILSNNGREISLPFVAEVLDAWSLVNPNQSLPDIRDQVHQRAWDDVGSKATLDRLICASSGSSEARLRAVSTPESGARVHALPSPNLGTLLDDDSLRVAAALRLGGKVCEPHLCTYGSMVEANGHHALSCQRCSGRFPRHHTLNELIRRALVSANILCALEPPGLSRSDGKRPDGLTMVPWKRGRCLIWDATCVSTFAPSHINGTTRVAGAAAELAARNKQLKYLDLERSYMFVPVAVETAGS